MVIYSLQPHPFERKKVDSVEDPEAEAVASDNAQAVAMPSNLTTDISGSFWATINVMYHYTIYIYIYIHSI